jgi:hypothetical protein
MMREIERFTGTPIKPMKMPTPADIAARRVAVLKETLRKELQAGELDLYVDIVTQLADEGPYDMSDVAAAAARIAHGPKAQAKVEPIAAPPPTPARGERPEHRAQGPGAPAEAGEEKVRLSMAIGKRDGVRPADIVGSIANEADVPGRDIGPIDIRDDITYVVVLREHVDQILEKVGRAHFKGLPVDIRVATNYTAPPPRGAKPPFERAKPPYDRAKPPYDRAKPPYDRAKPPYERAKPPFDRAKPPYDRAKPPYDRAKPPFDRDKPRFAGAKPRPAGGSARPERRPPSRDARGGPPPKGGAFSRFARPGKPSGAGKPGAGGPKKKR